MVLIKIIGGLLDRNREPDEVFVDELVVVSREADGREDDGRIIGSIMY